jgi:hypothetical protein
MRASSSSTSFAVTTHPAGGGNPASRPAGSTIPTEFHRSRSHAPFDRACRSSSNGSDKAHRDGCRCALTAAPSRSPSPRRRVLFLQAGKERGDLLKRILVREVLDLGRDRRRVRHDIVFKIDREVDKAAGHEGAQYSHFDILPCCLDGRKRCKQSGWRQNATRCGARLNASEESKCRKVPGRPRSVKRGPRQSTCAPANRAPAFQRA